MTGQAYSAAVPRQQNPDKLPPKAVLLLASMATVLLGGIIAPALPAIEAHFAPEVDDIAFWSRLVLTLPALSIVIGAPMMGYVVDRIGRKGVLIVSMLLFGLAGGAGYFAGSLPLLLVSRAVMGLAVAGVMTSVTTLISDYYVGQARSRFIGLQTAFMGIGGTVFPFLGGILAEGDWRTPFLIYLAAFALVPLTALVLYEPARSIKADSLTPAGPASAEKAPVRLMLFIFGATMLLQIVFNLVPVQFPFHLRELMGATASQSGLAIAAMSLAFALTSAVSGWIGARFERMTLITAGFLLTGVGYGALGQAGGWALIAVGMVIGGVGFGLVVPALNVWIADEAPPLLRGRILSGLTTSIFLGQFLSPIISQPLAERYGLSATYVFAGALLVCIGLVFFVARGQIQRWQIARRAAVTINA